MSSVQQWMIYGAYGYTGELMAREAVRQGLRPILAGRSAWKLLPLAKELGLEYRETGDRDNPRFPAILMNRCTPRCDCIMPPTLIRHAYRVPHAHQRIKTQQFIGQ